MEGLEIKVERLRPKKDITVIRLNGYLDITTARELDKTLRTILESHDFHIVVDLSKVDYISSAGWGVLVADIKKIRNNGGDLKLAGMQSSVHEVFDLLEFSDIFEAYDSVKEAVGDF